PIRRSPTSTHSRSTTCPRTRAGCCTCCTRSSWCRSPSRSGGSRTSPTPERRPSSSSSSRSSEPMRLRVVQWTTGNVGKQSAIAIARNPALELVGCWAWSPDKVGRDVGELCGIEPLGVTATDDVDALLALRPDCVVYTPMWPSVDELVRILGAGVNVVTTAAFINGRRLGPDRERLVEACARGGSSLFGTGISPGLVELVSLVVAGMCDRIDKITVNEAAYTMGYDSPETEKPAG